MRSTLCRVLVLSSTLLAGACGGESSSKRSGEEPAPSVLTNDVGPAAIRSATAQWSTSAARISKSQISASEQLEVTVTFNDPFYPNDPQVWEPVIRIVDPNGAQVYSFSRWTAGILNYRSNLKFSTGLFGLPAGSPVGMYTVKAAVLDHATRQPLYESPVLGSFELK